MEERMRREASGNLARPRTGKSGGDWAKGQSMPGPVKL